MSAGLNLRLSTMMFLQYAIWGAWLPILYPFLLGHRGFSLDQVGTILAAGAFGAIIGPFLAGHIADRHFATQKFLGISHLVGAALVWALADADSFHPFLRLSLVYGLVYAPTLSLTNSLSFHHLPDRDRDFGRVRVWGTVGWIAAGIAVGHWLKNVHTPDTADTEVLKAAWNAGRADAFRLSAILGGIMGLYCFTLPNTPPSSNARESNAAKEALREIARKPLWVLFFLAVPVSCIHQFYFVHTADYLSAIQARTELADKVASSINSVLGVGGGGLMTIGQMAEILVLACIPLFARKVSRKTFLAVGLMAYAARMALFAHTESVWLILAGVALHGLCFGCFIFVAFMVVDEETSSDVRASAQSLFNLVIVGVGIIVGSILATQVAGAYRSPRLAADGSPVLDPSGNPLMDMDYHGLFSVPMWASLACLALLLILYPNRSARRSLAG